MKKEIIDQFLSELSRSSEHTQSSRRYYAEKFLDFAGETTLAEWNKSLVNRFIDQLEREGYAKGTIRTVYGVVKRVFDAAKVVHEADRTRLITEVDPNDPGAVAGILKAMSLPPPTWDMGKRAAPRVESEDLQKPAATLEEIQVMVEARDRLSAAGAAYLSLSTVYGLRREELCRVAPEHLDFDLKRIYVLTAKGGERRYQVLCDEVIPYLKGYNFAEQYSLFKMSYLYRQICAKAGVTAVDGSGWHAPRRFLDTELITRFGELPAHIFLRWKISSSALMPERYFSRPPMDIDREVLAGHPVVPLWR